MRSPRFRFIVLCIAILSAGCGRYQMNDVRHSLADGDLQSALEQLQRNESDLSLPYLFERGLVAHYAGQFDESNRVLDLAERIAEDLYTRSFSREAAALLTSDNTRAYAGTRYERLMVHYYRAFNYLYLNELDEALVECRRAGQLLQAYADEDPAYNFAGAALIAYLSGILYEMAGDWNDAYISYRWAEVAYGHYAEALGVEMPADIGHALVRLARRLGFTEDAERYAERYGEPAPRDPDMGEVILFYESGFVPQREEENVLLPILKSDKLVEERVWSLSDTLVKRRHHAYKEEDLEYLLRVAIPRMSMLPLHSTGVEVEVGQERIRGTLVEDVARAAQRTFEAEQTRILLRTAARGLLKYLAYRRANKEGRVAGLLVNAFNVITERADTRSWETLPNRIDVVRMALPAGKQLLQIRLLDRRGRRTSVQATYTLNVRRGGRILLNHRSFD